MEQQVAESVGRDHRSARDDQREHSDHAGRAERTARETQLEAQVRRLERDLQQRLLVEGRLLKSAEELIGAPRPVAGFVMHEDDRSAAVVLDSGAFFIRKLTRKGWDWCEGEPIPGTPAGIYRSMLLDVATPERELAAQEEVPTSADSPRIPGASPSTIAA